MFFTKEIVGTAAWPGEEPGLLNGFSKTCGGLAPGKPKRFGGGGPTFAKTSL